MEAEIKDIPLNNSIAELFLNRAQSFAQNRAIIYRKEGKWEKASYKLISEKIVCLANSLKGLGINKGDRVAILSENRIEYYITELAIMAVGAVAVPLYISAAPSQISYVLYHSGSKLLFVSDSSQAVTKLSKIKNQMNKDLVAVMFSDTTDVSSIGTFKTLTAEITEDEYVSIKNGLKKIFPYDTATIIYTSGTSGDPKGVMLTHKNILANVNSSLSILPVNSRSTCISLLPLSHSFEKTCGFLLFFLIGASIAICDNYANLPNNLKELSPTHIIGVPKLFETMEQNILREVYKKPVLLQKFFKISLEASRKLFLCSVDNNAPPTSALISFLAAVGTKTFFSRIKKSLGGKLELFVCGGSRLKPGTNEFFNSIGIKTVEGYGLTEASPVVSCNRVDANRIGTVGKAIPGVLVKTSESNEILVRGDNVMRGYYKDDESTAKVIDDEGWLHTGDMGLIDKYGFITITGRIKEIIVTRGGKNIAPQRIESMLTEDPCIKQVFVAGEDRDYLTALIVPSYDTPAGEYDLKQKIDSHVKTVNSNLSNYEKIRRYRILEKDFSIESGELTPTLKVKRFAVEKKYGDIIRDMYA
jgi:long-chain acyl-CoA synthetase